MRGRDAGASRPSPQTGRGPSDRHGGASKPRHTQVQESTELDPRATPGSATGRGGEPSAAGTGVTSGSAPQPPAPGMGDEATAAQEPHSPRHRVRGELSIPAGNHRAAHGGRTWPAGQQGLQRRYVQAPGRRQPQSPHTVRGRLAVSTSAHQGRELHARTRRGRTRGHGGPAPPPPAPPARGPHPPQGSRGSQTGSTSAGDSAQGEDSGRAASVLIRAGRHPRPRGPARD